MKSKVLIVFILIIFVGCSASDETVRNTENYDKVLKFENEVNLEIDKNICWVNVMPGTTPKFHVSGRLSLSPGDNYSDDTQLKYIRIFQSGSEIYYIMPKVIVSNDKELKNITYSTIKGLSVSQNLDTQKPVMLELVFIDKKEEFRYRINNVNVEKVQ